MSLPLSLVVSTLGRSSEVEKLLHSLQRQDFTAFELVVIDQNDDRRLEPILTGTSWTFPIIHVHQPGTRGVCRGRNEGWRRARGEFVLFPDDDCWYPDTFLTRAMQLIRASGADFVSGRACDESGRTINGRFATTAHEIERNNVWLSGIEWLMVFRRSTLEAISGFDEQIGPGSGTPWAASEGPDLMFRALKSGARGVYDPSLCGHHAELNIYTPDETMVQKGRGYARGMGFVLAKSGHSPFAAAYWVSRSLANMVKAALRGNYAQFRYYSNWAIGRLQGYLDGASI